jgi:cobalt/nickel transport system permease protein
MHVPDGFFEVTVSVGTAVVAAGGVAVCLRKAGDELDERTAPLAGAVAAFIFAVQMINFPVGLGTSGHLMGGALAAILVGPYAGALCVTVVLAVQALVLADGGLTALGINIVLMAFTTTAVGWLVFRLVRRILPATRAGATVAAGVGAFISVPAAALLFVVLFAIGGNADLPLGGLAAAMTGFHVLIGIGEGLITAATVGFVAAVRPDLVFGLRDVLAREQATLAGAPS